MDERSAAALYGKGIFTTIAISGGVPFLWEKHWRRLADNAGKLDIDLAEHSEDEARSALLKQVAADSIVDGRARITFHDDRSSSLWPDASIDEPVVTMSIITAIRRAVPDPFCCGLSTHTINSTSPLARIKSCNYLENLIAYEGAKSRGFDEVIRINEHGRVTSACMANVFWLKDEKLFTPALSTGCLPGTTREYVLESMDCDEVEVGIDELNNADAIFLTSVGLGVVQVDEFGSRQLDPVHHPILDLLPY